MYIKDIVADFEDLAITFIAGPAICGKFSPKFVQQTSDI